MRSMESGRDRRDSGRRVKNLGVRWKTELEEKAWRNRGGRSSSRSRKRAKGGPERRHKREIRKEQGRGDRAIASWLWLG